jgi:hypothetical protein
VNDGGQAPAGTRTAAAGHGRAQRASGYDPGRARARLALIEQQARLASAVREREEILSRQPAPAGPADPLQVALAQAATAICDAERQVRELIPVVGDPEAVVDEQGRLPAERRERFLGEFAAKFNAEVADLRERMPALRAELAVTRERQQRAAVREELRKATARLAYLDAVPPFTAAGMCSECPSPMSWHAPAVTFCLVTGAILSEPCPAWPLWREQLATGLLRVAEMMRQKKHPPPAPAPVPQPLAVIPAAASVEETIARLTAVQAEHPGAQVRRGKRSCWEIWAAPTAD